MKELKDIKSVLRAVLAFTGKTKSGFMPKVVFCADGVGISIDGLNHKFVSRFVRYFRFLTSRTNRWVTSTNISATIRIDSCLDGESVYGEFCLQTPAIPIIFMKNGNEIKYGSTYYSLDSINLD